MLGTNDVSRAPVTLEGKWEPLLVCLLNELKEKSRPRLVVLCVDTAEPGCGHAGGGFYERQRDPVERDDPQSGGNQSQRAATHGS